MNDSSDFLRHALATLAYRTEKALAGAPESFGGFEAGGGVRTPHEILVHMRQVLTWATSFFEGQGVRGPRTGSLQEEIPLFRAALTDLGDKIKEGQIGETTTAERLFQGPIADALTHAGQLALLRRLAGTPIEGENFHDAKISLD